MSRVGKEPITVPEGVEVVIEATRVHVKGPKGEIEARFDPDMQIALEDGQVTVRRPSDHPRHRSLHGLTRSLIANMVEGVTREFERTLEIHGIGYRADQRGKNVQLTVGFSHPVLIEPPEGVTVNVESPTVLRVRGVDKQQVGEVAAQIRQVRPPEPYKGKGIRYAGEHVRRKAGKAVAGGAI